VAAPANYGICDPGMRPDGRVVENCGILQTHAIFDSNLRSDDHVWSYSAVFADFGRGILCNECNNFSQNKMQGKCWFTTRTFPWNVSETASFSGICSRKNCKYSLVPAKKSFGCPTSIQKPVLGSWNILYTELKLCGNILKHPLKHKQTSPNRQPWTETPLFLSMWVSGECVSESTGWTGRDRRWSCCPHTPGVSQQTARFCPIRQTQPRRTWKVLRLWSPT